MEENVTCKTLENNSENEIPITTQEYNNILNIQNTILDMMASHEKASDIFKRLCLMAEALLENSVASVMLQDKVTGLLSVLSAPSVPEVGKDALKDLKPGPTGGSCGNAVFFGEAQYVSDTFTDKKWEDIRQVAYDFNLCSCWSMPVRDKDKKAVGTFALASFEHRSPAPFHKKLLEMSASIVSIILRNQEDEQRIKLFSTSMQNATEGMMITDADNNILEVNKAFEKIYGYKEKDLLGKNPRILAAGKKSKEYYVTMWESLEKDSKWSDEIINRSSDGENIAQWLSISKITSDDSDTASNYLAIFTDLRELKAIQKFAQNAAFEDALTKLPNKASLDRILSQNIEQTLVIMNVNNFSYINTVYGFDTGDKLLIKLAEIFQDMFGVKNIFRINSDEFGLLLDSSVDITGEVRKIKNYFYNKGIHLDTITLNISFTYGAFCGTEKLLRNASSALKLAKQRGRNTLLIFDVNEAHKQDRTAFIESNKILYRALGSDNLIPYYQGIRDNLTKKITKFEVLARIKDKDGIISPYRFLDAARLSGVLPEITKIMIDKSFKEMSQNTYVFSINITEEDLVRQYLLEYLNKKSQEYGIEPGRVILEILEGVSSNGKKNHIEQLSEIKEKGYSLAIDDFGSEYSNFERVLDLEIDFLKIDARYIKDIHTNKKSYEITRAIVFFAKTAKIPCIAEFVHDENVQAVIDELDINFSQGFYFSKLQAKPQV